MCHKRRKMEAVGLLFWKKKRKSLTGAEIARLSKAERKNLIAKLKEEARQALDRDDVEGALVTYRQLIALDPEDPDHRRRLADCHQKLGNPSDEFAARVRAATLYGETGFLLKGIAMCKMALALDPNHQDTQKQLAEFNRRAGRTAPEEVAAMETTAPSLAIETEAPFDAEAALRAAQARVERVRKARAQVEAARAASEEKSLRAASEVAPVPSIPAPNSIREAPSLSAIALRESIPSVRPFGKAEELHPEKCESEEEIFIAPLDDELDVAPAVDHATIDGILRRTPLLHSLGEETFVRLIDEVTLRELSAGETLFEAGSPANAMYVVVEGRVAALTPGPLEFELANLGEGDFFGEIGLLQTPRPPGDRRRKANWFKCLFGARGGQCRILATAIRLGH
jgi:cAMP-dependent protein kinase regulator